MQFCRIYHPYLSCTFRYLPKVIGRRNPTKYIDIVEKSWGTLPLFYWERFVFANNFEYYFQVPRFRFCSSYSWRFDQRKYVLCNLKNLKSVFSKYEILRSKFLWRFSVSAKKFPRRGSHHFFSTLRNFLQIVLIIFFLHSDVGC